MCEGCCDQYFIQCTSWMLRFPINYILAVLFLAVVTCHLLLMSNVIQIGVLITSLSQGEANFICIQIISAMLTYAAIAYLPELILDCLRLIRSRIAGVVDGQEWSGGVTPSRNIFDYVPWFHRMLIITIFIASCYLAVHNQLTQVMHFNSNKSASENNKVEIWSYVYICASLLLALVGKVYKFVLERKVKMEGRGPDEQDEEKSNIEVGTTNSEN